MASVTMYYADWCGNCTRIKPVFNTLSKRISADFYMVSDVDMKRGANPTDVHIEGYPTFVFRVDNIILDRKRDIIVGANEPALRARVESMVASIGAHKVDMNAFGAIMRR